MSADEGDQSPADQSQSVLKSSLAPIDRNVEKVSTYLFAADKAAPRRKRASDVVQFAAMAIGFGLLAWLAGSDPPIDARVLAFFDTMPSWVRFLGWVGYTGSFVVLIVLVIVMMLRGGLGRGVLRDVLVTFAVIFVLGLLVTRLSEGSWPVLVAEVDMERSPTFPTLRTAMVLAGAWILAPYVTAPVQRALRWTAVAAVVSPLLLTLSTLTHLLGAIALAAASVAAVRMLFGSPEGLPPIDRLSEVLRRVGVEVHGLAYLPEQPGTVGLATGLGPDGQLLNIKVYGEDVAQRQRAERVWRAMWYRDAGPMPRAGRLEQSQNESLALLMCRRAGVRCAELVTSGQDVGGDVVVVSVNPVGRAVGDLDPSALGDEMVANMWLALSDLHHTARLTHGRIRPDALWVDDDAQVAFVDFLQASTLPTLQQTAADVAALLATTAVLVGADVTTSAAVANVDRDDLVAALPFVQEAAIEPDLRRAVKHAGLKVSDLRTSLADALEIEEPEPAPIRRVSVKDLVMVVFAIIAANALLGQIADVGFDTLIEELRNASTGWLVVAFLLKLLSYTTTYIGLRAVLPDPIPFAPTTLLQSAKSYVGLVVPSMVGRVGLDIRFLQKQGVPTTVAATQGPVISAVGFVSEVVLLLFSAWAMGQAVETDDLLDINVAGILTLIIAIVVIGIIIVFAVPKLRAKTLPVVRDAWGAVKSIMGSPSTLARVFTAETLERLINALALGATVAAFGVDLSFTALIFVSVGTGLLAGLAPVPGGIGVAEATMTALLTAVGVDPELSVSIAIVYRLVTAYIPPVLGFFSLDWLTKEGYL